MSPLSALIVAPPAGEVDLWTTVTHSGPVVFSVLVLLILMSVFSWGIIAFKARQIRRARLRSAAFLEAFWHSRRLDDIYQGWKGEAAAPLAQVFRAGYVELSRVREIARGEEGQEAEEGAHLKSRLGGLENVERALRRARAAEMGKLEALIPFLATVGSTSPFIGLFGTVIGIMVAFQEIGAVGSASLAVVAPGISEALVATAAGLAAAIPAVMAYNFFVSKLRVVDTEMESFSSDFLNLIKRHFL